MRFYAALCGALGIAAALPAQGRGDYLNFESPQVKPIAVARVAGHDYVLACNTPDSSVEVYDTIGLRFVARVPVGQEPVSVVWNPALSRFYTANMLGDSVSVVRLAARSSTAPLEVKFEHTTWVGDEPMMIAFHPDDRTLFVTHNQKSAMSWRDSATLSPVAPGFAERIELTDSFTKPTQALKEPRAMARSGSRLFVLGFRGGHSFFHDLDVWGVDFSTLRFSRLGGLGTLKTGIAAATNGDLWIVGGEAQNRRRGEKSVAAAPTGFVTSLLHRVVGAGSTSPRVETRDLNTDSAGAPVARSRSLAHPQDVVLLEKDGRVEKVFLAAFHSDRIGVIDPRDADPRKWGIRAFDMPVSPRSANPMSGPRGLALKRALPQLAGDPGERLYVLNRLDNSIGVVDPVAERVLRVVPLAHDPTPQHVRDGRPFLYSAKLSGNGFVSCASCHLDGRADGNGWDLSAQATAAGVPLAPELIDGVTDERVRSMRNFPIVKGFMVTQSLQGLVNSETEDPSQHMFSNIPYHWRADTDFLGFNAAFVNLQGMRNLGGPNEPVRGISPADMRKFEEFVNSITYPPNPEQPLDRNYSGTLGRPDGTDGTGALRGLKLFHTERVVDGTGQPTPMTAGRSCVQCHFLPEGSNNRITRLGVSTPQPVETAALRFLLQKEAVIERNAHTVGDVTIGEFGTEHQGTLRSINDFTQFVFGHEFERDKKPRLDAMTQFVREFDTGVAPLVGVPLTVTRGDASSATTRAVLALFENQARSANVGIAVQAHAKAGRRGFWFDPSLDRYAEEPSGATYSRTRLLALLASADDRLVFQATPLGSERRIASPTGKPVVQTGPAPSRIRLEAMATSTAWRHVPQLTKNWVPGPLSNPLAFAWTGVYSGTSIRVPEPPSLRAIRLLQHGLVQARALPGLRHEAPRRFRVSGRDIRPGAKLVLHVPNDPKVAPPYDRGFRPMIPIVVQLFATGQRGSNGLPIYESAVEADPQLAYVLALGGPSAPGVASALANDLPEPPKPGTFAPGTWNKHWVWVVNADGTYETGGWQPISIR